MQLNNLFIFNFNKKFCLLLFILISLSAFAFIDGFIKLDWITFRQWENFKTILNTPSAFIPNKQRTAEEHYDRYKSINLKYRNNSTFKTTWITDELGFRNDPKKTNFFSSVLFFIGDSNFMGSSFDQSEIISEVFQKKYNINSYNIGYNFPFFLNNHQKLNSIKYINLQGKFSYWSDPRQELSLSGFRLSSDCSINIIKKKSDILNNFNLLTYIKERILFSKPFYQYLRSKLKVYKFNSKIIQSETQNKNYIDCSKKLPNLDFLAKKIPDISPKQKSLQLNLNESLSYFYLVNKFLNNYFINHNIYYSYFLIPEYGTPQEFYKLSKFLNNNKVKIFYYDEDKAFLDKFWQIYDSHWEKESVNQFSDFLYKTWIKDIENTSNQ